MSIPEETKCVQETPHLKNGVPDSHDWRGALIKDTLPPIVLYQLLHYPAFVPAQ